MGLNIFYFKFFFEFYAWFAPGYSISHYCKCKLRSFLNNVWFFLIARGKVLNFKSKIFPLKNLGKFSMPELPPKWTPEPTPDPTVFDTPNPTKV